MHVFDRMTAERAKIAKENRSAGELEAKRILAEADLPGVHTAATMNEAAEKVVALAKEASAA